jgi:hypothetical protein
MEVIWGNRLKTGDYKFIGGFPHFVADSGDERVGRWLDERIDLARIYAQIWKDAAPAHVVDVPVFCDSDDTHTASIRLLRVCRARTTVKPIEPAIIGSLGLRRFRRLASELWG